MKQLVFLVIALTATLTATPVKKQRTTRQRLRVENATTCDSTRAIAAGEISLAGYDKPLRSRKETIFVSNALADSSSITALRLTITYRDSQGRQLHKTSRWIQADIPHSETRQLSFPSWDTQQSFYYRLSKKPRTTATPYDITATVDSATIVPAK